MWKHAALLIALPFTARATLVYVDYEGTVDRVERDDFCECTKVGDPIKGRFVIDTDRKGRDLHEAPGVSYYGGGISIFDVTNDFVVARKHPSNGVHDDYVNVFGGYGSEVGEFGSEGFTVADGWRRGELDLSSSELLRVGVQRNGDLLDGPSIVQSFSVVPDANTTLFGQLEQVRGRLARYLSFALTRLTVKPGSCKS